MIAQLPDGYLLIVDTKATGNGFDATWPNLRALVEYVKRQQQRQRDLNEVFDALIVSSGFLQNPQALSEIARKFYGETSVALALLTADALAQIVDQIRSRIDVRNAIQWKQIFSGGPVLVKSVVDKITRVKNERYSTRTD